MTSSGQFPHPTQSEHDFSIDQISAFSGKQLADGGIAAATPSQQKDTMERVKSIGKQMKLHTKKLLQIDDTEERLREDQDGVLCKIEANPAFNPSTALKDEPSTIGQRVDQLPGRVQKLASTMLHPKNAAKGKASENLATSEEPYLSQKADEHLLAAHRALRRAEASQDEEPENGEQVGDLKEAIDAIEENRERSKVAWTSSRFTHRAQVVQLGNHKFPVLSSYRWVDSNGEPQGYRWAQWFGHFLLFIRQDRAEPCVNNMEEELVWDRDILLQHVERIVMASSPLQRWLLRLRQLWRWENPIRTATWLAIWLAVWYCDRVFTFIYCYAVCILLQRRLRSERRDSLQNSRDRALDPDAAACTFGEMINRYGSSKWLDPMLESVGPGLQLRTNDLADWMEVLINFYEWKSPRVTAATLIFFGSAVMLSTFMSADFCMRIVTLVAILMFFLDYPASSRYPKYRNVIAPVLWILWDIPTHSETSFQYLRKQAEIMREPVLEQKSDPSDHDLASELSHHMGDPTLDLLTRSTGTKTAFYTGARLAESVNTDVFATQCTWNTITGRVVISFDSVRFVRNFPKKEIWTRPLNQLIEIRKTTKNISITKKSQHFLELDFDDGSTENIEEPKKRDELFNIIISFSGSTWQQMQPRNSQLGKKKMDAAKEKVGFSVQAPAVT